MLRPSRIRFVVALSALTLAHASLGFGAVPANETLLPETTKGAVLIRDVDELVDSFNKTQMGKLLNDPLMQPFLDDVKEQMKAKWRKSRGELGITIGDLEHVASGEVAIARAVPAAGKSATIVLADVTGNNDKAQQLLEKISAALVKKNAKQSSTTIAGAAVTTFDIPATIEIKRSRSMFYTIHNDLLVVTNNKDILAEILSRQASKDTAGSLAKWPAFRASMDRATRDAGNVVPQLRFFIEPIAYAQAIRASRTGPRKRGTDMLKIAQQQGFDAIQGIAGVVNFAVDKYEMLYRVDVYAPPIPEAGADRYKLAMRMMTFFNDSQLDPPAWVHTELATFTRLKLDIGKTFEASKTFVNAVADSQVFEDVLDSLKTAPDGPKIDVREHVIKRLGGDVVIMSDYELPITVTSERLLFAIETNDADGLAATVAKAMKADPKAHRREFQVGDKTYIIWEMVEKEVEDTGAPVVELGGIPGLPGADEAEEDKQEEPLLPNKAITVAFGRLMIASHIDFLKKVLENSESRARLTDAVDFRLVATELERLGGKKMFVRSFSRTDEEYRPTYELIKQGKMPESKTMLGMMLNRYLAPDLEADELREQQIDGSKLPDFEVCRRYLGPAGMLGTAEENGWYISGFVLSKENPSALKGSSAVIAEKETDAGTRQ